MAPLKNTQHELEKPSPTVEEKEEGKKAGRGLYTSKKGGRGKGV